MTGRGSPLKALSGRFGETEGGGGALDTLAEILCKKGCLSPGASAQPWLPGGRARWAAGEEDARHALQPLKAIFGKFLKTRFEVRPWIPLRRYYIREEVLSKRTRAGRRNAKEVSGAALGGLPSALVDVAPALRPGRWDPASSLAWVQTFALPETWSQSDRPENGNRVGVPRQPPPRSPALPVAPSSGIRPRSHGPNLSLSLCPSVSRGAASKS